MATPSEIILQRSKRGENPARVIEAFNKAGGPTTELRDAEIMELLGGASGAPAYLADSDYNEDATLPSFGDVLSALDIHDTKDKKAYEIFLEDFPKNAEKYKRKITKNPKYGDRGWETVKKIWQQASIDKMNSAIAENRRKIASGEDEEGLDWLHTKLVNLMYPRATEAVEEGRDPTTSEVLRDIGANAAYAVPVGRVAGFATRGMAPIVKGLAQASSQAAAPTAVAITDNLADDSRTMDDLTTDALEGTLANLGVNKILGPGIGRAMSSAAGKISASVPPSVKAILEGTPTGRELAAETVAQAQREVKNAAKEFNPATLAEGKNPTSKATASAAKDILEVADASNKTLDVGGRDLKPSEVLAAVQDAARGSGKITAADENRVVGSMIQQLEHPNTAPTAKNRTFSKEFNEGVAKYSKVLEANPELKTLFAPPEKFSTARFISPFEAYAVNQFGSSGRASDVAGAAFGVDVKKMREDTAKRKNERQHEAAVSEILGGANLTDADYKYLEMVKKDPKVLKFSQDPKFKEWLLTRGNDLLRGTPYYRNAWEVE